MQFITSKPELANHPSSILAAIDEFGRKRKYLMNVGELKGNIVTEVIRKERPNVMIELGGYCGYSTILFASEQKLAGGSKYFSLERSPNFAKNIGVLVKFAGLGDFVEVIVGPSNESIKSLHQSGRVKTIDMMFLDHYKPAYTTDLKLCESLGLIKKGTVLAADNVIAPGNPPYLKYVRSTPTEKRLALANQAAPDTASFASRSAAQYGTVEELSTEAQGNPDLAYKSELINSFEPTGVPVSRIMKFRVDREALMVAQDGIEMSWCLGEVEA